MGDPDNKHPRLILDKFLTETQCKELEFIHKSCCTVGYRPNVFSTTILHLIATKSPHLIMPLIPIRDKLKDIVEDNFGCEYQLFVEFTGLISWCKGASIGWHSDDNRDYLKQRHFAAVCYLNSYGVEFEGGLFHFQDGDNHTIVPMAGDAIIYTADERNIHAVDEITKGERTTLTLWFSRTASHDEDVKILKSLGELRDFNTIEESVAPWFPIQASKNMYWFPPEEASKFQSGFDIRIARLHVLGFNVSSREEECLSSVLDLSRDFLNLLENPLHLAHEDELIVHEFVNLLHALQVLQFYHWKAPQLNITEAKISSVIVEPLSDLNRSNVNRLKTVLVKDFQLADTLFGHISGGNSLQGLFDIEKFSAAVSEWEVYSHKLHKEMILSVRFWQQQQSIFPVLSIIN